MALVAKFVFHVAIVNWLFFVIAPVFIAYGIAMGLTGPAHGPQRVEDGPPRTIDGLARSVLGHRRGDGVVGGDGDGDADHGRFWRELSDTISLTISVSPGVSLRLPLPRQPLRLGDLSERQFDNRHLAVASRPNESLFLPPTPFSLTVLNESLL